MVTAEAALVLPLLVGVAMVGVWGVAAGVGELRCVDAAVLAAREAARGTPPNVARTDAARLAPPGAVITVTTGPDGVVVRVAAHVGPLLLSGTPWVGVSASAAEPRT